MSLSKKKQATLERKASLYRKLTRNKDIVRQAIEDVMNTNWDELEIDYTEKQIQDKFCE